MAETRGSSLAGGMHGVGSMVGAWDSSLEFRMSASAVGLLSVRVAAAAARVRSGGHVNERDRAALEAVAADLREEARVLRGQSAPDVTDETAYAVAGVALTALGQRDGAQADVVASDEDLAGRLDELAAQLEALASGSEMDEQVVARIETVFLRAGALVSDSLGQSGELLEGVPEVSGTDRWS
jgi:hypothetical protein